MHSNSLFPKRSSNTELRIRSIFSSRYSPRRTNIYSTFYFIHSLSGAWKWPSLHIHRFDSHLFSSLFSSPTLIYLPLIVLSPAPSIRSLLNVPVIFHGLRKKNISSNFFSTIFMQYSMYINTCSPSTNKLRYW